MTTPTTMEERFAEKFCRIIKEGITTEYILLEKSPLILEEFIQSEIDLAVEKREKEIVEELKDGVGYGKFGFSRMERMHEGQIAINMEDIINLITKK